MSGLSLITWNVNGLRSFPGGTREILRNLAADILCVQETKIARDVLTADVAIVDGFNAYFAFAKSRKGYSGVATFCSDLMKPTDARDCLSECDPMKCSTSDQGQDYCSPSFDCDVDDEGRAIVTEFEARIDDRTLQLCIINVYCPRWDPDNPTRLEFKMRFHRLLSARIRHSLAHGKHVIVVGDLNVAHRRIDHCEHHLIDAFDKQPHRLWIDALLADKGGVCVDVFREFHPRAEKAYTCWNQSINARATNYGTRIDYILADRELFQLGVFHSCRLMPDVLGSDHCPVMAEFVPSFKLISSSTLPSICCRWMPEFRGVQTSIRSFLTCATTTSREPPPMKRRKITVARRRQTKLSTFFAAETTTKTHSATDARDQSEEVATIAPTALIQDDEEVSIVEVRVSTEKGRSEDAFSRLMRHSPPPPPPPVCRGHREPCVQRLVKKDGPNKGRRFFVCSKPAGAPDDPRARCSHFQWQDEKNV